MDTINIIKIPFEGGAMGRNRGCSKAPDSILGSFSDLCSEKNRKRQMNIAEVKINSSNFEETHEAIRRKVSEFGNAVIIGGDHSITYSAFRGSGCDGIVILDAHPDVMAGTDRVTHEDFLRKLVEEGAVSPDKVLLFGLRSWHSSEMEFLVEKKIRFFPMANVFEFGMAGISDSLMELAMNCRKIYLSIDIDVADPAFAPGTGFCEPGGLSSRELIYLVQRLKNLRNLRFIDLVEISPEGDENRKTLKLGEKIIRELF